MNINLLYCVKLKLITILTYMLCFLKYNEESANYKRNICPGVDNTANELLKYEGENLNQKLTTLIGNIFSQHRILDEWRTSIAILLFKKRDKMPENYRGINLLCTTLKLTTKIITNKINEINK